MATPLDIQLVNPLMGTVYYSATSKNMTLVHWPLMCGLLQLVQRGGTVPVKGLNRIRLLEPELLPPDTFYGLGIYLNAFAVGSL